MGCDYYILKVLKIKYKDSTDSYVELDRQRMYYSYDPICDSDDSEYESNYERYTDSLLKVTFVPVRIFSDDAFKNEKIEEKYRQVIHRHLIDRKRTYDDILDIYKAEIRQVR
jgi:hypothetical protein